MRILLVGASGTIGSAVAAELGGRHDVILASRQTSHEKVDITDPDSVRALFSRAGHVDAVVCAAGRAVFKPLADLTDDDFALSLRSKLMGQINLYRIGLDSMRDGGSFTLTAGYFSRTPIPGSAAGSLVNAALEGFGRAAALEAPRGIRVNVVSPGWVAETLVKVGRSPDTGIPAVKLATYSARCVEGTETGLTVDPVP